jgi:hypothetical protein
VPDIAEVIPGNMAVNLVPVLTSLDCLLIWTLEIDYSPEFAVHKFLPSADFADIGIYKLSWCLHKYSCACTNVLSLASNQMHNRIHIFCGDYLGGGNTRVQFRSRTGIRQLTANMNSSVHSRDLEVDSEQCCKYPTLLPCTHVI